MCFWQKRLTPEKQAAVDEIVRVLESAHQDMLAGFQPFTDGPLYFALKDIQAGNRQRLGRPISELSDSTITELRVAIENFMDVVDQGHKRIKVLDVPKWTPRKYKKAVKDGLSLEHAVRLIEPALSGLEPPNALIDVPDSGYKLNKFCTFYGNAMVFVQAFNTRVHNFTQ